jgi:hypothetical protein
MAKSAKSAPKTTPPKPAAQPAAPSLSAAAKPTRPANWLAYAYLALLLFIGFSLCRYVFDPKEALVGDNTDYFLLGKALASGEGYVNIADINKAPHHHFPPGYPLLIAALMKLGGTSTNAVKALNGAFLLASLVLLFGQFRRLSGNVHLAFVGGLFVLVNLHVLDYTTIEMSEMSFLFFSLLALIFFGKIDFQKPAFRDPWLYAFIAALAFSYHIRNVALALLAGAGLVLLYRRRWAHLALTVGGFGLLCLPWYLRNRSLGADARVSQLSMVNPLRPELGHLNGAGDWISRIWENKQRYLTREIPSSVFSFNPVDYQTPVNGLEWILGLSLLALLVFGFYKFKTDRLLLAGYALATLGILIIYPTVWTGVRLLFHLIPFLIFASLVGVWEGAKLLLDRANVRNATFVNVALPLLLVVGVFLYTGDIKQRHLYARFGDYEAGYKAYFEAARWAGENTPPDAVIACRKQSLFNLFSNRYVAGYAFTDDQRKLLDDLKGHRVTHLVLDALGFSSTPRYLYPLVTAHPDKFEIVLRLQAPAAPDGSPQPETYVCRFRDDLGWQGEYQAGKPAGRGEYRYPDGRKLTGTFPKARPDSLTGTGTLTDAAGKVLLAGRWRDGQFVGP